MCQIFTSHDYGILSERSQQGECARTWSTSQHHESAPLLLCGHPPPHFRSGARSRRVRSREVHTDPCPENQATLLAYHDPRAVQVSSLILVHDPWCPSTIPTVDGLSDQQSTCAKVLIESSPWMRGVVHRSRWASHVLGRATHALIRGGCRISFRFRGPFSGLVRVIACVSSRNCARNLLSSILSRMARDASSNQSWRQLSRFWYRHPYLSAGVVLVATGDRMVATRMSHRTPSLFRDGCVHGWIPLLLVMHGRNDVEWV